MSISHKLPNEVLTYTRSDHVPEREIKYKSLVELQHDMWFLMNDNDPDRTDLSASEVAERLSRLIDLLVGKPYKGPFVKEDE